MKAELVFSNGFKLCITEDQYLVPIRNLGTTPNRTLFLGDPVKIENHVSYGLDYSILEFFANCDYFAVHGNSDTIYSVSSVVSVSSI